MYDEEVQSPSKFIENMQNMKRKPLWLQLTICSSVLFILLLIAIVGIGHGEYDKQFCEERLDLLDNEKPMLFEDQKTKMLSQQRGERLWGCCRLPEGEVRVNKKKHCIYTPEYKEPTFGDKFEFFLKRFK